jgi:hypothetical protein
MAKLATGSTNKPRTAPFSLCVSSGAKLLKTQHGES